MSNLQHLLENTTETVFTAEFPSIDGNGMEKVAKEADRLRPWFDAVNSTDNAAAHAHASNLSVAIAIKMHGLEPIMQIAQRDKNRLAVQADIMGAALHGIENIAQMQNKKFKMKIRKKKKKKKKEKEECKKKRKNS